MSLISINEKLFESKEDSDVTFVIDNMELHAHQFVLINRSTVLKAMIKGPLAPANQVHHISDPQATYDDFNDFLKFLYTDKCEITAENAEALLHLSHMYDVEHLFEACVNILPTLFPKTSPVKFAEIGLLYENKYDIVKKCLNEVPFYLTNSLLKYPIKNRVVWISPELVLEFVKHCPRYPSFCENIVFNRVFEWVKGQCEGRKIEINSKNLKEIFAPFEPYICFEKMDIKILSSTVYENELIPEKRLLKCYHDHFVGNVKAQKFVPPVDVAKVRYTPYSRIPVRPREKAFFHSEV
uniref:BTB domain-containing protein n=1 Tax=Panagrolaimus davidi TaxID=227884 RepID=A0A914QV11_9BILA